MILKLINNKNTYSFEVEDLNNGEKLFYHFQIPTADIEDGNYKMVLLDGDEIVTEEQVCIGAYNPQAIQYSRGENVYINAPFDANLEDVKEVEITSIETTVLPSEGYDGIKAVEVNAQHIYNEGYNVGNTEGIEVGKTEQKALLEPITITENGTYENENGYSTIEVNVPDTNGSYDEGYTDGYAEGEAKGVENAGEIIAETARVLDITENGLYVSRYSEIPTPDVIPEGNLIKTVNVNVVPKIDIAKEGLTFAYSKITELPAWADMSNVTSMEYMFSNTVSIIDAPYIDTAKATTWENCFWSSNVKTIPNYNTENTTRVDGMFYNCKSLETPPTYLNLLKCENMEEMFYDVRIKDYSFLSNWDINPKAKMSSMITEYDYVEYIPAIPNEGTTDYYQSGIIQSYTNFNKLTYLGGYIGRKYNLTSTSVLPKCPNLTYESCISILNNLYDFTGNGETPESSMGQLKVHPNFLTTVGEEISIGTNKGWIITA